MNNNCRDRDQVSNKKIAKLLSTFWDTIIRCRAYLTFLATRALIGLRAVCVACVQDVWSLRARLCLLFPVSGVPCCGVVFFCAACRGVVYFCAVVWCAAIWTRRGDFFGPLIYAPALIYHRQISPADQLPLLYRAPGQEIQGPAAGSQGPAAACSCPAAARGSS